MAPATNIVLPSIRALFSDEVLRSTPSPHPGDKGMPFMPLNQNRAARTYSRSSPLPMASRTHSRRASTCSTTSSVPSLSYSPSPSPTPSPASARPPQRQCLQLIPCSIEEADAVVVPEYDAPGGVPMNIQRRDGKRAVLLVGPAIAKARREGRKMHPYRIVRPTS